MGRFPVTLGRIGAVFCVFLLLGALYTYPLFRYFFSGMPYTHSPAQGQEVVKRAQGDYLQFDTQLWLFQDAVFGPTPLLANPYEFVWEGPRPAKPTYFLPLSLIYLILAPLGRFAAYNGFVIASFGLAGLAMFLLAREFVEQDGAALLAAAIFALAPYRYAVLAGGQPAGSAFCLIPLAVLGIERTIRTGSRVWSVGTGAALFSLALVEPQFLYLVLLLLPPLLLVRLLPPVSQLCLSPVKLLELDGRQALLHRIPAAAALAVATLLWLVGPGTGWRMALTAGLVACVLVGVLWAISALTLAKCSGEGLAPSLGRALWCVSPLALLAVSPLLFLWDAPRLRSRLAIAVASLVVLAHLWALCVHPRNRRWLVAARKALMPFWPLGLLLLATLGFMLYVKQHTLDPGRAPARHPLREIALFSPRPRDWLVRFNESASRSIYPGAVAVGLATIGVLFWRRRPPSAKGSSSRRWIVFLASVFLLAEILSLGPNGAPLPLYRWLYDGVPYFGLIRQTSKFQVLAVLTLGLLAAVGVRTVTDAYARNRRVAASIVLLLLAAIVLEYWPGRLVGISVLPIENRVYRALREAETGNVAYVPIWPGDSSWSSLYEFATTLTRRPMINGYLPLVSRRYVEEVYWPLDHLNLGELTEGEYARLQSLGVRFLVLDEGAFPSKVSPFPSGFTLARLRASPYLDERSADPPLSLFVLRRASAQPAGSLPTTPYGLFFQAARLPRQVGNVVDDPEASGGHAVRAADGSVPDRKSYLLFGAKVGLPRGRFRILFRVRGRGPADRAVARIEAVTDQGTRAIASRPLIGREFSRQYEDQELGFSLDRPELVEFRVWRGEGEVAVDYLYGLFADQEDPQRVFRSGEFSLDRGPFRRYAPGEYLVRLRTRVERRVEAPLARFTVMTAHDGAVLSSCVVLGTALEAPGVYEEIALPFRLDALRVLEFRIETLVPGVSVDQITVVSRDRGGDRNDEQIHRPGACLGGSAGTAR